MLKKFLSFSLGSVGAILLSIITLPILTRLISPDEFGIATIFMNIGLILSILVLGGYDQAFVRFYYENNNFNLLKKALLLSLINLVIVILIIWILKEPIENIISKDGSFAVLLILYVISLVIFRYSNLILRMEQKAKSFALVEISRKLLDFIFVVGLFVLIIPNHYSLIIGYGLSLLAASFISLSLSFSFWRNKGNKERKLSSKEFMNFSWPLLYSNLLTVLFQTTDKIILSKWDTPHAVGVYSGNFKLIAFMNIIQHTFTLFWTPVYLEKYKREKDSVVFFGKITRWLMVTLLLVSILIILFKDFLVLFLGDEYRQNTEILGPLVLMPLFLTLSEATMIGINIKNKTKYHLYISALVLGFFLMLVAILVPLFKINGMAFSVGLSYLLLFLLRTIIGQKLLAFEIKLKKFLFCITILLFWIVTINIYPDVYLVLLIGGILNMIIVTIIYKKEIQDMIYYILKALKSRKELK